MLSWMWPYADAEGVRRKRQRRREQVVGPRSECVQYPEKDDENDGAVLGC